MFLSIMNGARRRRDSLILYQFSISSVGAQHYGIISAIVLPLSELSLAVKIF
jgi:hypothetical protein